jgi:RimJ/RimL family protein N-acetyltransferase
MLPFTPALPLETERLGLRTFRPDDIDALHRLRGREDVARWLYQGPLTLVEAEEHLERRRSITTLAGDGDALLLAVELREGGEFVGDCMLRLVSGGHACAEIGYTLHPDHQARGYATELARTLLRVAFDDAGLHRVIARCEPRNTASWRVMERLGMRREAHFVENEWIKDEWQSELVYALLDREWASAGATAS